MLIQISSVHLQSLQPFLLLCLYYLLQSKNPPDVTIEFHDGIKNLKSLNCYSNEGNKWRKSNINFINDKTLQVSINEKFIGERGRINCSLRDPSGYWRWLGVQFVISDR